MPNNSDQSDTAIEHDSKRSWSEKMVWSHNVDIYEKGSSPFWALVKTLIAAPIATGFIAPSVAMYHTPRPSALLEQLTYYPAVVGAYLFAAFGLLLYLGIAKHVGQWFWREIGTPPSCEFCGSQSRYPHKLSHRGINSDDGFEIDWYKFCSRDCRELWERENADYDDELWVGIQTDGDKEAYEEVLEKRWQQESGEVDHVA